MDTCVDNEFETSIFDGVEHVRKQRICFGVAPFFSCGRWMYNCISMHTYNIHTSFSLFAYRDIELKERILFLVNRWPATKNLCWMQETDALQLIWQTRIRTHKWSGCPFYIGMINQGDDESMGSLSSACFLMMGWFDLTSSVDYRQKRSSLVRISFSECRPDLYWHVGCGKNSSPLNLNAIMKGQSHAHAGARLQLTRYLCIAAQPQSEKYLYADEVWSALTQWKSDRDVFVFIF